MIELTFGESSAGGLKMARSLKWEVSSDPEDVHALSLALDIGNIQGMEADISNRRSLFDQLYAQFPGASEEIFEKNLHTLSRFEEVKITQEPIRMWICSSDPAELCGVCYVCSLMAEAPTPLYVVRIPEQVEKDGKLIAYRSTGEISPEEFCTFVKYQEPISEVKRGVYADLWRTLSRENAPLRVVINGSLVSVSEDFYDFALRANMPEGAFKISMLIGIALFQIPGVGDLWLYSRIKAMLQTGELITVAPAAEGNPYSEVIRYFSRRKEVNMQSEKLQCRDKEDFIAFCLRHRNKLDDSFLYDENLKDFTPDEENPTAIVRQDGKIIAAASLIMDDYNRRGRSGRFRIFYSENNDLNIYSSLLQEVIADLKEIDKVFLYVPLINIELSERIKSLDFKVDRYVYLLLKEIEEQPVVKLPEGYSIREFQVESDEEAWCYIRNTAFSNLKGSSTPITPEMVRKQICSSEYLEGGLMFLTHDNKPVGIIRGAKDNYEDEPAMNIGPLAILPEYQGKGLGRQLLRAAIGFAHKMKYKKVMLCVNADNEKAKELYLKEGFTQVEGVAAYEYHVN